MTLYDGFYRGPLPSLVLYTKPVHPVATPWEDDAIDSAGDANEAIGEYRFPNLNSNSDYEVFLQAGGAPASTDVAIGVPSGSSDATIDYGELTPSLALALARLAVKSQSLPSVAISVTRGTTWRIPLAILPGSWDRIEVTARNESSEDQSDSLFHVVLTNPGDAGDGLQIWNGSTDDIEATDGAISEGDDETAAVCELVATRTADAVPGDFYCWDAKVFDGTNVDPLASGTLIVERDVTRTSE